MGFDVGPAPHVPVVQLRHEFSIVSAKNETVASATVEHMNGVLWLTNIWTHHEYRQKGYATAVITDVLRAFGDRTLYLKIYPYTDRPMHEAQLAAFYARFGFTLDGSPGVMVRPGNRR